jgi:hypothetical protein
MLEVLRAVATTDYPKEWPYLLPAIMNSVRSNDQCVRRARRPGSCPPAGRRARMAIALSCLIQVFKNLEYRTNKKEPLMPGTVEQTCVHLRQRAAVTPHPAHVPRLPTLQQLMRAVLATNNANNAITLQVSLCFCGVARPAEWLASGARADVLDGVQRDQDLLPLHHGGDRQERAASGRHFLLGRAAVHAAAAPHAQRHGGRPGLLTCAPASQRTIR